MNKLLSIIVPAYNEEKLLQKTVDDIAATMDAAGIPFEIIFVDDGSTDGTWGLICTAVQADARVRGVRLSRNFGKESALFAGLARMAGDCCVVMDCDLQHPPQTAAEMYRLWLNNGVDIVEGRKKRRGHENMAYRLCAGLFYNVLHAMAGINLRRGSDFKLLDRRVVEALLQMPERQTFFRAMPGWMGFHTAEVIFEVPARGDGRSRWTARSLARFAVNAITGYTNLPMQLVSVCGAGFLLLALALLVRLAVLYLSGVAFTGGELIGLLLLAAGGIIMLGLGVIGVYIGKIYEEVKSRPRYIVRDTAEKREEQGGIGA